MNAPHSQFSMQFVYSGDTHIGWVADNLDYHAVFGEYI